jgi:hypothetical protein
MPVAAHSLALGQPPTSEVTAKAFVVALSTDRNLQLCRSSRTAGFPDTKPGRWAYLDVEEGDYVTFYYNGRLWDLYRVTRKYVPDYYADNEGRGDSELDPVSLGSGDKWTAIMTENGSIYFPYRLEMDLLSTSTFNTNLVFRPGRERLGINLVPRVSLKKSHFQVGVGDLSTAFECELKVLKRPVNFRDFSACVTRERVLKSKRDGNKACVVSEVTINDATASELYLQSLLKRVLESHWDCIAGALCLPATGMEFYSEQTVHGGEADISVEGAGYALLVEVKNGSLLKLKRAGLTRAGQEALDQVQDYQSIHADQTTLRCIAGKAPHPNLLLNMGRHNDKWIIEVNAEAPLSALYRRSVRPPNTDMASAVKSGAADGDRFS